MILKVNCTYAIIWAIPPEAYSFGDDAMKLNREELCHEARNVLDIINDLGRFISHEQSAFAVFS